MDVSLIAERAAIHFASSNDDIVLDRIFERTFPADYGTVFVADDSMLPIPDNAIYLSRTHSIMLRLRKPYRGRVGYSWLKSLRAYYRVRCQ